jgi:shikimate dehydrogenase
MDVYGLVGSPVGHSVSPPMHEAAYDALDLEARYVTFEPEPGDLATAVEGARALGVAGLNVTVPYKRRVADLVDCDPLAARIGAVNTVDFRPHGETGAADGAGDATDEDPTDDEDDGDDRTTRPRPTGHNTDAEGARRALREAGAPLDGRAVVVGAGGAGRAVAVGLADAGAEVTVANRTVERAEDLAAVDPAIAGHPLGDLPDLLADAGVLVNATTVGMEEDASPVPREALHADLWVLDAVYRPLETRLLREATAAGAHTVTGDRMLLYQGVAALERWTGRQAPVGAMERALERALQV